MFLTASSPMAWSQSSSTKILHKDGFLGLETEAGKELVPARYEKIGWSDSQNDHFINSVIGYQENGNWGLMSEAGKILTPPKFSILKPSIVENLFIAAIKGPLSKRDIFGVVNAAGKTAIPFEYSFLELQENIAIAQTLDGNLGYYGLVTHSNQIVLPFEYLSIKPMGSRLYSISRRNGKISLVNDQGQVLFGYELDSISPTNDRVFEIYHGAKVGLISSNGELLIKPHFKKYEFSSNGLALSYLHFNKWSILGDDYKVIKELTADSITQTGRNFIVSLNGYQMLFDQNFESISGAFGKLTPVTDRLLLAEDENGLGVINTDGNLILNNQFQDISIDGRFIYAQKNKWHVYDTVGTLRTPYGYDSLKIFSEERLAVKRNDNWGFIDSAWKEVIPCIFSSVTEFENGKSKVRFHGEEGVIDRQGDWLILPGDMELTLINDRIYLEKTRNQTRLKSFSNELIYFTDNQLEIREGYLLEEIDSITTWVISLYGTILSTTATDKSPPLRSFDSLSIINRDGLIGVVSDKGSIHIPFGKYEEIHSPSEGLLGIKKDGYYGFIDLNDQLRIANRYEDIGPFSEGMAAVKIRGKWGFIDKGEILVCQPLYSEVDNFENGIAKVSLNGVTQLLNKNGEKVQTEGFDSVTRLPSGNFKVTQDDNIGLLDNRGMTKIQTRYETLEEFPDGKVLVERRDKYGVLDGNGVNIIPIHQEKILYDHHKSRFILMGRGEWETIHLTPGLFR